jgi:hypothetical protein
LALLLSGSIYSRSYHGLSSDDYDIDVEKTDLGIPVWLVFSIHKPYIEGISESHPEEEYKPGFQIIWFFLVLNVFLSIGLAIIIHLALISLGITHKVLQSGYWEKIISILIVTYSCVVGSFAPTEPTWIGVVLGLVVLPMLVASAGAYSQRYSLIFIISLLSSMCVYISSHFSDHFRQKHMVIRTDIAENTAAMLVFALLYIAFGSISILISRYVSSKIHKAAVNEQRGERALIALDRTLDWQQLTFEPRDAIKTYPDGGKEEIDGGWDHEHCAICWATISSHENPVFMKSSQDDCVCLACFRKHVEPRNIDFIEEA